MKTAVSIPDRIFQAAERAARRRGIPRSQLYTEALEKLLAEETDTEITAELDRAYAEIYANPDPDDLAADQFRREATRRTFKYAEWNP